MFHVLFDSFGYVRQLPGFPPFATNHEPSSRRVKKSYITSMSAHTHDRNDKKSLALKIREPLTLQGFNTTKEYNEKPLDSFPPHLFLLYEFCRWLSLISLAFYEWNKHVKSV